MKPHRIEGEKQAYPDVLPSREDNIIAWVWLVAGVVLMLTDIVQSRPWGAWSSLGMLISGLAIVGLARHYATRWKRNKARQAACSAREV